MFVCFFAIGCGGKSSAVPVYPVSGEVFFKGQPADGAAIHFHPVEKGSPPAFAIVQEDGTFELSTYGASDGAAAGDYIVTLSWRDESPGEGETILGPDRLGGRYSKRDISNLRATVSDGENALDPFNLKQ